MTREIERAMHAQEQLYEEAIERIMADKESCLDKMEYFGLNQYEAEFFKLISQGRFSEITGKGLVCNVFRNRFEPNLF